MVPEQSRGGKASPTLNAAWFDLVALGLSNAQAASQLYLSRHTVDFHLRQIFRKLNIGSRVELARLSFEHQRKAVVTDDGLCGVCHLAPV